MLDIMDRFVFVNGYHVTIIEDGKREEEVTLCMMSVIVEWGKPKSILKEVQSTLSKDFSK